MQNLYKNNEVTDRILNLIQVKKISRYKLASDIGVSESALSKNISGKSKWGVELLLNLASYFGVSLDWLVTGKDYSENLQLLKSEIENLKQENSNLKKALMVFIAEKEKGKVLT